MSDIKTIWSKIYQTINGILYFILNIIKGIIRYAVRQIRGEL